MKDTAGLVDIELMTSEERMDAIIDILAKSVLRLIDRQTKESRDDKAFGEELAKEVVALPGDSA